MHLEGRRLAVIFAAAVSCCGASRCWAAALVPGELLVTDPENSTTTGDIVEINPVTDAQSLIASGGLLAQPIGVCIDLAGQVIVCNYTGGASGTGSIVSVNPVTGAQTPSRGPTSPRVPCCGSTRRPARRPSCRRAANWWYRRGSP
jgi:hypothetical protein